MGDDHEVQAGEPMLVLPEALANEPLETVAAVRAPNALLRDRKAEARRAGVARAGEDREVPVGRTGGVFEYPPKVASRAEPAVPAERTVELQRQELTTSNARGPSPASPG